MGLCRGISRSKAIWDPLIFFFFSFPSPMMSYKSRDSKDWLLSKRGNVALVSCEVLAVGVLGNPSIRSTMSSLENFEGIVVDWVGWTRERTTLTIYGMPCSRVFSSCSSIFEAPISVFFARNCTLSFSSHLFLFLSLYLLNLLVLRSPILLAFVYLPCFLYHLYCYDPNLVDALSDALIFLLLFFINFFLFMPLLISPRLL
jgi:hypothetical protein